MTRATCVAMAAACVTTWIAGADTVTFLDGSTMDGVVREINENCVELDVGETQFLLQRSEFTSFEKNDKRGVPGKTKLPMVEQAEMEIDLAFGLNAEQRDEVMALINALWNTEDPAEQKQLEERLLEASRRMDVVKFIQASYEPAQIRHKMPLLNALALIRPSSALALLRDAMLSTNPAFRGFALRMYARALMKSGTIDKDALTYLGRGLVDHNSDVQLAAAYACVELAPKPATPVLVAALGATDPRVQNVADQALLRIWQVDPALITGDRTAYWAEFWKANSAGVDSPIDPASMTPLVDKDAPIEDTHH